MPHSLSRTTFLAMACALVFASVASAAPARPNIVLIISDDHGWPYYGFAEPDVQFLDTTSGPVSAHLLAQTPRLDSLANEGVLFRNGYTTAAICLPSLKTLLSASGLHWEQWEARREALEASAVGDISPRLESQFYRTLPRELQRYGYVSWEGGKMWSGSFSDAGFTHGLAEQRNSDVFTIDGISFMREGWDVATCGSTAAPGASCPALDPLRGFLDEALTEGAPFFVWFAPLLPHAPFNAPQEYVDDVLATGLTQSVGYFANVRWLDEAVGELLDELEARGIRDDTLVVFVSDNGWGAGSLQGPVGEGRGKDTAYAIGSRTPILFSWPGQINAAELPDLISSSDIPATILGFAGANDVRPIPEQMGIDLRARLAGGPPAGRSEIVQHDPTDSVLQPPWRYLVNAETGLEELYRIDLDPLELVDLAATEPVRVADMRARAAAHRLELLEPPERTEVIGRVVDPETGAPVVAAQLRLGRREIASTDSAGYFAFGPFDPGAQLLRPQKRVGPVQWRQDGFLDLPFAFGGLYLPLAGRAKGAPVESARGRMRGVVTDAVTGAPIEGAAVKLKARSPSSTPRTMTDAEGTWLLEGLPANLYRVRVTARGYRKGVFKDVAVPTGDAILDLPAALQPR